MFVRFFKKHQRERFEFVISLPFSLYPFSITNSTLYILLILHNYLIMFCATWIAPLKTFFPYIVKSLNFWKLVKWIPYFNSINIFVDVANGYQIVAMWHSCVGHMTFTWNDMWHYNQFHNFFKKIWESKSQFLKWPNI